MPKRLKDVGPEDRVVIKTKKGEVQTTYRNAVPAKVVEIIGRVGVRGEATQVRCKILQGIDKNKIMRRNVRGPVRTNDVLMLKETELEAAPLKGGRRK